jgi:hypothetical protein
LRNNLGTNWPLIRSIRVRKGRVNRGGGQLVWPGRRPESGDPGGSEATGPRLEADRVAGPPNLGSTVSTQRKKHSDGWKKAADRLVAAARNSGGKVFFERKRPAALEKEDCVQNAALVALQFAAANLTEDGTYVLGGDSGKVEAHTRKRAMDRTRDWLKHESHPLKLKQLPSGIDFRPTFSPVNPSWMEAVGVDGVEALLRREDPRAANVFRLHAVYAYNYAEIAATLSLTLDQTKKAGAEYNRLLRSFNEVYDGHGPAAKVDLELAAGHLPEAARLPGPGRLRERRGRPASAPAAARHQRAVPAAAVGPEAEQLLRREEFLATPISDAEVAEMNRLAYLGWGASDLSLEYGTYPEVIKPLLTPLPHSIKPDGIRYDPMGRPGACLSFYLAPVKKNWETVKHGAMFEDGLPCPTYGPKATAA